MQTEASVVVNRPIEVVFDYTNDHVTEWSKTAVEQEVLEKTPQGVGTRFRMVTEDRGRRMEFEGVVTRYDRPRASAVRLEGKAFDIVAEYSFEDLGDGRTRVTQRATIHGKGLTRMVLALFGWLMKRSGCKAQREELESLAAKVPAG